MFCYAVIEVNEVVTNLCYTATIHSLDVIEGSWAVSIACQQLNDQSWSLTTQNQLAKVQSCAAMPVSFPLFLIPERK